MSERTSPGTSTPDEPAKRPWSTPSLLAYGHIGKLTQGSSGTKGDSGTKRR
jgi:hypothetical protein